MEAGKAHGKPCRACALRRNAKAERANLDASFKLLDGSDEGRKTLYAVVPKTPGNKIPTVDELEAAGVMARASIGSLNCSRLKNALGCTTFNVNNKGRKTYVIMLDQGLLQGAPGAAAPMLGHELRHVKDRRSYGANVSLVKLEQAGYLNEIHIGEQLKQQGKLCSDQSLTCQQVRLDMRIWEGNLNQGMSAEFTNTKIIDVFNQALKDESKGIASGTGEVKRLVQQQFQREDKAKEEKLGPYSKQKKEYDSNNSALDKVINDDDFRKALNPVKTK